MPKISIIIPVYNTEKYLSDCLESVINQTFVDIEIICVNDGSKDNSLNILYEYEKKDSRIKIIDKENEGAAIARNIGIKNASGDYLYFLDSDDYIKNDFCEKMYNQITKTKSDICICRKANLYYPSEKIIEQKSSLRIDLIPSETFSKNDVNDILYVTSRSTINKLYRKEFIIKNNIQFQNLSSCNDVFFECSTLTIAQRITYIDEALFISRRNRTGAISETRGSKIENIILALDKYKNFLIDNNLYHEMEITFYQEAIRRFDFESQFCRSLLKKYEFLKKVKVFLPIQKWDEYVHMIIKRTLKKMINWLFSITNVYKDNIKYKKVTFIGMSHKFKIENNL